MLENYNTDSNSDARIIIYIRILTMLSAASQEDYLYHVDKGKLIIIRKKLSLVLQVHI